MTTRPAIAAFLLVGCSLIASGCSFIAKGTFVSPYLQQNPSIAMKTVNNPSSLTARASNDELPGTSATAVTEEPLWWSQTELEDFARAQGVDVSLKSLGPGFRAVGRSVHNSSLILGYVEGFVRPQGNILHLDKMQVFTPSLDVARREHEYTGGGSILGVGVLLGYLCLLHGTGQYQEKGDDGNTASGSSNSNRCRIAEFLAIDDGDVQHKRLVKLYTIAGFDVIKYVGEDFGSIPDRLVWGGCGTLLRKDISTLLTSWTRLLSKRRSSTDENKENL